jgi:hypothetical protein
VSEESKKKMLLLRISVGEPWECSAAAEGESAAAAAVAGSRGELEKTARLLAYVLMGVIG